MSATRTPAREKCRCASFEPDRDFAEAMGMICTCGHTLEEHGTGFLASCEADEIRDDDE